MAFGIGFNKAKVQSGAEKLLAQGKIPAAIDEYRKILDKDPKDLMVLNTIADLYIRAGKNDEAMKLFYDLGEKCVEVGLVPRAIAVYKRITKISPESIPALARLGELYSMQGLLRESREHYLQAVDFYTKRNEKDKARDLFEKILMLDLENPRLQLRMAELYAETGKKQEAIATYLSAVERFLDLQRPAEAGTALETLVRLDPQNAEVRALLGRLQLEQGEFAKAAETLESIPSPSANVLKLLFRTYTSTGDEAKARNTATQLWETHGDFDALAHVADQFVSAGKLGEALEIYETSFDRLAQQSASSLQAGLQKILAADGSHAGALQLMLKFYHASGKVGESREITERLGQAYVAQGELEKAREIYVELATIEPDNPEHLQMLRQVESQMGVGTERFDAGPESAVSMLTDLSAEPSEEAGRAETLSPLEDQLVKSCLTESDLYKTYRQISKAIEALENGLLQLPGNTTLNEHLVPLYEEAKDFSKAAQCCEALTQAYVQLGDGDRASRYGELIATYQQKAADKELQPAEPMPAEKTSSWDTEEAPAVASGGENDSQVREVDLSMEWASVASTEEAPAASQDSAVEEIEFYIQAGLIPDATAAIEHLRERSPSHPAVAQFEQRLGLTNVEATPAAPEPNPELPMAPVDYDPSTIPGAPPQSEPAFALEDSLFSSDALPSAAGFELSLDEPEPSRAATVAATAPQSLDPFADLAGELEGALKIEAPIPARASAPVQAAASAVTPAASTSTGESKSNSLQDLFAEFQAEMEEPAATDDLETHYNMGVAFKEMALYDEAIGEFQKVHQIASSKKDYSHVVQCCSLLATCFLEKGMPQLAVKWYQTAIDSPGVDPESILALLYEMGSAYEVSGERQAALKSFLDVYARNIDYRDVAERIRSIQQTQ